MTEITPEEQKIFRDTFNQLDSKKMHKISLEHIGFALRSNNQCPTEAEIRDIIENYMDPDVPEGQYPTVDFEEFCAIMKENWKTKEELIENVRRAFLMFDKAETGLADEEVIRNAMLSMGEAISEDEIKEFMRDAGCGTDGKIPYEEFCKHLVESYARPQSKKAKGSAKSSAKKGKKK